MRDNLMFYKIEEEKEESSESKVIDFIETKLGIDDAADMKIHRAHRVGTYNKDRIRPIVVKFAFFPDRERVRKKSFRLKGTPFGISEQFPKEVLETRGKLVPIMKKVREDQKELYMTVDTLFINGR